MAMQTEKEERLYVGQFTIHTLPKSHTDVSPDSNGLPRKPPQSAPFSKTFNFRISHVVHNTHAEQKRGICATQGRACFIAKPKGKSKSCGKLCRMNYKDNEWNEEALVNPGTRPLPGNYVWFSMKPTLPKDEGFKEAHYPVSYVNNATFYGPWDFTFEYKMLIEAYSKKIPDDAHVILKNGGTLVYQREVCYVVIITHSKDQAHDNETYPTIKKGETTDGVLEFSADYNDPPTFHPKCVPPPPKINYSDQEQKRWIGYDWRYLQHYDQVAFAVHCDWEGNCFEIDLPKGQPHCFFSDHSNDEETYRQFHPICLSRANSSHSPYCYDNEFKMWKKEQEENEAAEVSTKRRKQ